MREGGRSVGLGGTLSGYFYCFLCFTSKCGCMCGILPYMLRVLLRLVEVASCLLSFGKEGPGVDCDIKDITLNISAFYYSMQGDQVEKLYKVRDFLHVFRLHRISMFIPDQFSLLHRYISVNDPRSCSTQAAIHQTSTPGGMSGILYPDSSF